nr:putative ribonuclease H-like domain-containing protein [Tanacetum cinerariifolium]
MISVEKIYKPTSAEEKLDRKNEIKVRGTLLMALPNKDQLKFHLYQDAKLLMEAIEKRLQKLISQLEIQGEVIEQEDMNLKLLRSLPYEWKTDALIWKNKADIETTSLDDLYNNLKIYETELIGSKVECFNCHKNGHFTRQYRALKNQENRGRAYGRKTVPVENPTENALIAQDGIGGYDWSYQAEEEHPTNYALMSLTSSGSSSSLDSETVESKHESVDVKSKGAYSTIETKPIMKNNFIPPIIEDCNSNDESEETNAISLIMKIIMVDLFPLDMDKAEFLAKLLNESQVLLRVLRKDNIYNVDLKSVVPTRGLTCLFAKATIDESNLWHMRLGHINYKIINKLVRGNLVRGLPLNIFENVHGCVSYQKGKQHKASYEAKLVNSISKPLHMLHMDLFGPTNVKSVLKKSYCLVVTDEFNRFS